MTRTRWNLQAMILLAALLASVGLSACQGGATSSLDVGPTQSVANIGDRDGDLEVVARLATPPQAASAQDIRIAQNDLLQIDVFQVDELDRTTRVDARGNISLPLIGQVAAAGETVPELESRIEARYGERYLQSPEVSVFIEESFGQRVTMDGEFQRPGIYPVTAQSTLLQVVAQAGGLSNIANERRIFVFRDIGGSKQVANVSLADIRAGRSSDVQIFGGDVVVAFTSGARVAARNLREALGIATQASGLASPL